MASPFIIGQEGTVEAGSYSYCVENWQITLADDLQEVTTVCSEGFQDLISGIRSGTLTATMFYDPAYPGGNITSLFGTVTPCTQPEISFSAKIGCSSQTVQFVGFVSEVSVENPAKNPVKLSFTARSSGPITIE